MFYDDSKALCKYSQWAIDENMKKMSVITSRGMNDKQMLNRQMSYGWRRPVLFYWGKREEEEVDKKNIASEKTENHAEK